MMCYIIKVEIGYYFLQSTEHNECDSICTLQFSGYYIIYKFMCDKSCWCTVKIILKKSLTLILYSYSFYLALGPLKFRTSFRFCNQFNRIHHNISIFFEIYLDTTWIQRVYSVKKLLILVGYVTHKSNWKCHFY